MHKTLPLKTLKQKICQLKLKGKYPKLNLIIIIIYKSHEQEKIKILSTNL